MMLGFLNPHLILMLLFVPLGDFCRSLGSFSEIQEVLNICVHRLQIPKV